MHVYTEEVPQQELVKGVVRGKVVMKVVPHERTLHVFDLPVRGKIGDIIHVPASLREAVFLVHVRIEAVESGEESLGILPRGQQSGLEIHLGTGSRFLSSQASPSQSKPKNLKKPRTLYSTL